LAKGTVGDDAGAAAESVEVRVEDGDTDEAGYARADEAERMRARRDLERNMLLGLLGEVLLLRNVLRVLCAFIRSLQ
jgi:hypothetical protein